MSSQIGFYLSSSEKKNPEGVSILNVIDLEMGDMIHYCNKILIFLL